ncbi:MAG: CpaF family protein [Acidobacteriota bacterium]
MSWAPSRDGDGTAAGAGSDGAGAGWGSALSDKLVRSEHSAAFQELKTRVHRRLLERLNLDTLRDRDTERSREEVRQAVRGLLAQEDTPLNTEERNELVEQVLDEVFGLGPLEPLLEDPSISDILVNTYDQVFIERDGKLEKTEVEFRDDQHLLQVIDRIVSAVGRRIDDSSPMVDARLEDGSRVHAIIPPLAIDGPHLSIRKFRRDVLSEDDLLRNGTLDPRILRLLEGCVEARLNMLISGGTGSGKTTLLNVLSGSIPATERIVTIEDSAELQLRQPHVVRLETRPPNIEGVGEVKQRELVINALRMRPDRIIVGEVRGGEALDMLQAMNTGHDGSLTTLHANSPRDALSRLGTMISMAGVDLPEKGMRQQVASALDIVVQLSRLSDGGRRVMRVAEIVGMEGDVITMQDLFRFERRGLDEDGNVIGDFRATGIRPKCAERLEHHGIDLEETLFSEAGGSGATSWSAGGGGGRG